MSNHKFTVETPERVICFSVTSGEAKEAFEWLTAARIAKNQSEDIASPPPAIVRELFGGFAAIAENRPYGGH